MNDFTDSPALKSFLVSISPPGPTISGDGQGQHAAPEGTNIQSNVFISGFSYELFGYNVFSKIVQQTDFS
jgi:hypothetical protein